MKLNGYVFRCVLEEEDYVPGDDFTPLIWEHHDNGPDHGANHDEDMEDRDANKRARMPKLKVVVRRLELNKLPIYICRQLTWALTLLEHKQNSILSLLICRVLRLRPISITPHLLLRTRDVPCRGPLLLRASSRV